MGPNDILLFAVVAVMMVMMFRSSRKRKKQAEEMKQQLVPGAKVMLTSGIIGTVTKVAENVVSVEIASGVVINVQKPAVQTKLEKGTIKSL